MHQTGLRGWCRQRHFHRSRRVSGSLRSIDRLPTYQCLLGDHSEFYIQPHHHHRSLGRALGPSAHYAFDPKDLIHHPLAGPSAKTTSWSAWCGYFGLWFPRSQSDRRWLLYLAHTCKFGRRPGLGTMGSNVHRLWWRDEPSSDWGRCHQLEWRSGRFARERCLPKFNLRLRSSSQMTSPQSTVSRNNSRGQAPSWAFWAPYLAIPSIWPNARRQEFFHLSDFREGAWGASWWPNFWRLSTLSSWVFPGDRKTCLAVTSDETSNCSDP